MNLNRLFILSITLIFVVGENSVAQDKQAEPRPFIGIVMENDEGGVRIRNVVKGSAAEEAGLEVNDVIVKFGDAEKPDNVAIRDSMRPRKVGDSVVLEVRRADNELTV